MNVRPWTKIRWPLTCFLKDCISMRSCLMWWLFFFIRQLITGSTDSNLLQTALQRPVSPCICMCVWMVRELSCQRLSQEVTILQLLSSGLAHKRGSFYTTKTEIHIYIYIWLLLKVFRTFGYFMLLQRTYYTNF